MTEHADRLREVFETHENQTPDPADVYARVQELSRKYQRRRRNAAVAGSAFLGVGLIAGAAQIPALMAGNNAGTIAPGAQLVASATVSPAPTPSVFTPPSYSEQEWQRYFDAYFGAGYDYDDALRLAVLWHAGDTQVSKVKAEAGRRLLAGETLPFPATPDPTGSPAPTYSPEDLADAERFFDAGYVYEDAVRLATLWKLDDVYQAKIRAGDMLEHGERLPFKPKPENVAAAREQAAADAFFTAGYDYDDAVKLAKLWKLKTPWDAKVAAGKKLLAGGTLPIKP